MATLKQPPSGEATAEAKATVDLKQRRRVRRAFQRFIAENEPRLIAAATGAAKTRLIVNVELVGGARFPRLALYRYDPVSSELSSDFVPAALVGGDKVHTGSIDVESGGVYILYCEYEGPPESGIDVNVFYPPLAPKAWPPDVGEKAGSRKYEASDKPRPFFVRVPTEGNIP